MALPNKDIILFSDASIESPALVLTPAERLLFQNAIEQSIIVNKKLRILETVTSQEISLEEADADDTELILKEANFEISISEEIVQKVLLEYKAEIDEVGSATNQFFAIISGIQNENYELFSKVFFFLDMQIEYKNGFTVQDCIDFIVDNDLNLDLDSIEIFLNYFNTQKKRKMKRKLFEGYYDAFGNLYNFLIQQTIPENTGGLFYVRLSNQLEKFTIKPKVAYYSNQTYKSFKQAEDAY